MTIAIGVITNVVSVPFLPGDSQPVQEEWTGFGPGVDGVVVDATGPESDRLADWLVNGLGKKSIDDSRCDVRRADFEVHRQEGAAPIVALGEYADGADMYILADSKAGAPTNSISLGIQLIPASVLIRAGSDPYLLSDMAILSPIIDQERDLELDASSVVPELSVVRPILVGIRELEGYRTSDLGPARCEFDAAISFLESQSLRSSNLLAAMHVLVSIAWVREASLLNGDGRSAALSEARASLNIAADILDRAPVSGEGDMSADRLVVKSNLAGVDYLELFPDGQHLDQELTVANIESEIATLGSLANEDANSGQSFVLLTTYQAKLALAAHQRAQSDPMFVPITASGSWLDIAERFAQTAITYGERGAERKVNPYLADSHFALGLTLIERTKPGEAAAEFQKASDLVGGRARQDYKLYEAVALLLACAEQRADSLLDQVDDYMKEDSDPALQSLRERATAVKDMVASDSSCK